MDIRADDVFRAMLDQLKADIAQAEPHARSKALVDFGDFVISNAAADGAGAIMHLLKQVQISPWDESWVIPELARATLDALTAWRNVANALLERLNDDTETTRKLREALSSLRTQESRETFNDCVTSESTSRLSQPHNLDEKQQESPVREIRTLGLIGRVVPKPR